MVFRTTTANKQSTQNLKANSHKTNSRTTGSRVGPAGLPHNKKLQKMSNKNDTQQKVFVNKINCFHWFYEYYCCFVMLLQTDVCGLWPNRNQSAKLQMKITWESMWVFVKILRLLFGLGVGGRDIPKHLTPNKKQIKVQIIPSSLQ